jgi:hypothetical protein
MFQIKIHYELPEGELPQREGQIRKIVMINPQIANPQTCKERNSFSDSDLHWIASHIVLT